MSYIDNVLQPGMTPIYRAGLDWLSYRGSRDRIGQ